ncbi:hypothetical protein EES43_18460 [Streptomyces sp. ADI96-02]|nr:hypothetical protein EES43_18460 [Streptomyces sp. ADI96-02]
MEANAPEASKNPDAPITLTVTGPAGRTAGSDLCAELESLLAGPKGAALAPGAAVECDVGGVLGPDLALVEVLARLALVARRNGRTLRLRRAPPGLRALLDLVGLADAVGLTDAAGPDTAAAPRGRGLQDRVQRDRGRPQDRVPDPRE